jgi:phosphoglycolate phosphatase
MLDMPAEREVTVFFDLDGCLIDSSRAIPNAMNAALADMGLPAVPASVIVPLIGPPLELFAVQLMERVGGSTTEAEVFARGYLRRYEERMLEDSTVYTGIPDALSRLSERWRLVVVTLKRHELAERLLVAFGLSDRVDFAVGSEGTEVGKTPLLARAIERAKPTRAAMVGDQPDDMAAARSARIPGLGVSWGFGASEALLMAGATTIVRDPSELEAAITAALGSR